ncbi:MAG: glycosyltransferase family 1 protein [Brumimicrobium sp.]
MKIGINTRFLLSHKMEGFGWYTYETMKRITQNHPEHEFVFFFDRKFDERFIFSENITPVVLYPPTRHPILQIIWFDYMIPRALKKYNCDCFVSTDGYLSLKTDLPQLTVMHDLNFEHNPNDLPASAVKFLRKRFPLFAKKATRLCTVSNYSKEDIVKTYDISPDKIDVAYNGVSPIFQVIEEKERQEIRKEFTKDKPFILFVGSIHKRKNLKRLVDAYKQLKAEEKIEHHLLIVGEPMWKNQDFKIDEPFKEFIHFTGHLSIEKLAKITASATCLAFVSYFEGFGIPMIEAMQSGTPVLAGNRTSLPEIGGDAAMYCDPYSVDSIKEGLKKLLQDDSIRQLYIDKGLERADEFSWDKTAEGLWKAIQTIF